MYLVHLLMSCSFTCKLLYNGAVCWLFVSWWLLHWLLIQLTAVNLAQWRSQRGGGERRVPGPHRNDVEIWPIIVGYSTPHANVYCTSLRYETGKSRRRTTVLSVIASLKIKDNSVQCHCEERCNFYFKCTRKCLVARLRTRWGNLNAPSDRVAGFKGYSSREGSNGKVEREGENEGGPTDIGKEGKGNWGELCLTRKSLSAPLSWPWAGWDPTLF